MMKHYQITHLQEEVSLSSISVPIWDTQGLEDLNTSSNNY